MSDFGVWGWQDMVVAFLTATGVWFWAMAALYGFLYTVVRWEAKRAAKVWQEWERREAERAKASADSLAWAERFISAVGGTVVEKSK